MGIICKDVPYIYKLEGDPVSILKGVYNHKLNGKTIEIGNPRLKQLLLMSRREGN